MHLAILGATSAIAKDLIDLLLANTGYQLYLFSRNQASISEWMRSLPGHHLTRIHNQDYSQFLSGQDYEVLINFVGVGDPVKTANMGSSIFEVTYKYDELCLAYQHINPNCRYLFMSSGAAYGSIFQQPASVDARSAFPINNISKQDWYGVAKMYAEVRHRSLSFPIVDIRIFNYFSATQNVDAQFFISELIRSIRQKEVFLTSREDIVRDYVGATDFYNLVKVVLGAPAKNTVLDCYSAKPINKYLILQSFQEEFGLKYEFIAESSGINATGNKPNYYSVNYAAMAIGYAPSKSSLDLLLSEARKMLTSHFGV
jgi:nucleoside-diphosphate-sugar epimerase